MAEYCEDGRFAVYRTNWVSQEQYRAKGVKQIGVGFDSLERFQTNLNQFGCVVALAGSSAIDTLTSYGFALNNIIIPLADIGWASEVDMAIGKGVNRFYIDEPVSRARQNMVRDAVPYITSNGGQLTLSEWYHGTGAYINWYIWGGRGYIGEMVDFALSLNPSPYVSCHTHFDHTWLGTVDPRDQWTYLYNRVPNLFKSAWIKTRQTPSEMGQLFVHANIVGLNQIILYPFDSDGTTYIGKIDLAAGQAWNAGWLERFQRERTDKWCCPTQTFHPDECDLDSWDYTGQERWV